MINLNSIPRSPGIYIMRDSSAGIVYIGKAVDLRKRVSSYFTARKDFDPKITVLQSVVRAIDYIITDSEKESLVLEQRLIKQYQPKFNVMYRDDKSYPYLKISVSPVSEKFYNVTLVRLPKKNISTVHNMKSNKMLKQDYYYGPFPEISHIKRLLKWMRKSFFIDVSNSGTRQNKQFLSELNLFFSGKYEQLKHIWQKNMAELSRKQQYEQASVLRDNIIALDNLFQHVRLHKIEQSDLVEHVTVTRALSELKEKLLLTEVPLIIEAFDISNTAGSDPVGSMVRFSNGIPDKTNYRRYKIKTVTGIDDFSMISEIVYRRYARLLNDRSHLPDLVLIDGGKGQLSAAIESFDKLGIKKTSVISIAKQEEEIFKPEKWGSTKINPEPIRLEKESPALHLIQQIRDESHRFAITYHRLRRTKRFL